MFTAFLIKYAEIGVKGKNRYLFEDALVQQIKYALKRCEGEFKVRKTQGRIYVDAVSEFDFDETVDNLKTVFGISGIGTRRYNNRCDCALKHPCHISIPKQSQCLIESITCYNIREKHHVRMSYNR